MALAPLSLFNSSVSLVRDAIARVQDRSVNLTVLTVKLIFRAGSTIVQLKLAPGDTPLSHLAAAVPDEQQAWEIPFTAFQPNPEVAGPLNVPCGLADDVRYRLGAEQGTASTHPLWLKLARPYGLLGTVPWERELGGALGRPVLRLPDFPERPAERPDVLENALLVDPAHDAAPGELVRRVALLVDAVLAGSSRSGTRMHIFTSAPWYPALQGLSNDPRVLVYNPDDGRLAAESPLLYPMETSLGLRSGTWSNWIATALAGRGIDAVHLICRAHRRDSGADILLSHSPFDPGPLVPLIALGHDELSLLLNRAGAWAITFAPAASEQLQAVAIAADSFAHRRPGAILFHSLTEASGDSSLATACQLLFNRTPSQAPRFQEGFLYCHPGFVRGSQLSIDLEAFNVLASQAALLVQRAPLTERVWSTLTRAQQKVPPNWVGATQRILESTVFDEARRSAPDVLLTQTSPDQWKSETAPVILDASTNSMLTEIQSVVANYLKLHKGD